MTTTPTHTSQGSPPTAALPPFRTPVRGHAFAPRPPELGAPVPGQVAELVPEPANPADPHAVAVWVGEEGRRWRIGYLDRGVAARVAPRLRDGLVLRVRMDGWTREPEGRWERPVVLLQGEAPQRPEQRAQPARRAPGEQPRRDGPGGGEEVKAPARSGSARPTSARTGGVWGRPPGVARRTIGTAPEARGRRPV
jgi:hypothetical protein